MTDLDVLDSLLTCALSAMLVAGVAVAVTAALDHLFRMTRLELAAVAIVTTQIVIGVFLAIVLWSLSITPRHAEQEIGYAFAIYDLAAKWLSSLVVAFPAVLVSIARLRGKSKEHHDVE